MKIAIHQPNFCPTKGYFDKIAAVDLFVIMIHCQWEKGKYQNRFHVGDQWNTMSVNHGLEPIKDKRYLKPTEDWAKITNRYPKLKQYDRYISESLATTNMYIIRQAMQTLGIETEVTIDLPTALTGTDRLVDICKDVGATEYLSGKSGRNYLELEKFEQAGIKVRFQDQPDLTPLVHLI